MSFYADLDIAVIDELPPGRTPVLTKLVADSRRDEVLARVREACAGGKQAYWVCPLIEESEALQLQTAIDTFERLQREFPELKVRLVHGRMRIQEKAAAMNAFQTGECQLLIATTVIEVGVDVSNASLMIIENSERMGLSQLHQLRGRIGRGAESSVCILLYQKIFTHRIDGDDIRVIQCSRRAHFVAEPLKRLFLSQSRERKNFQSDFPGSSVSPHKKNQDDFCLKSTSVSRFVGSHSLSNPSKVYCLHPSAGSSNTIFFCSGCSPTITA